MTLTNHLPNNNGCEKNGDVFTMENDSLKNEAMGNAVIVKLKTVFLCLALVWFICPLWGYAEQQLNSSVEPPDTEPDFYLKKALMCERLKGSDPINTTVVFSGSKESAFCFNVFDPVLKETIIFHNWYYQDKIVSRLKRTLKPPRWETYSVHKIGKNVKGPWRVEIVDDNGNIISVLRFSVTD